MKKINGKIWFFIFSALIVLLIGAIIWTSGILTAENISDVAVEFHGMIFDVLLFGIVLTIYEVIAEKRKLEEQRKAEEEKKREQKKNDRLLSIKRYKEELDDYRGWYDNEAAFRVNGIIKRLQERKAKMDNLHDLNLSRVAQSILLEYRIYTGIFIDDSKELLKVNFKDKFFNGCFILNSKLKDTNFINSSFSDCHLSKNNFSNSGFVSSSLTSNKLNENTFEECLFGDVDFSFSDLSISILNNVVINNCTFWEATLQDSDIIDSKITDSNLHNSNFSNAKLIRTNFNKCNMLDSKFNMAYIEGCSFNNAFLMNSHFDGATLCSTDFRGANLEGVSMKNVVIEHKENSYNNPLNSTAKNMIYLFKPVKAFESQKSYFISAGISKEELEKIEWTKEDSH